MNNVNIIVSGIALLFFNYYLIVNVAYIENGSVGIKYLIGFFLLCLFIIITKYKSIKKTGLRRSAIVLVIFWIYFIVKIAIDIGDPLAVKSYMFGTTGGMITFYILGALTSVILTNINILYTRFNKFYIFDALVLAYFIINAIMLLNLYNVLEAKMRDDIFAITQEKVDYQRPGDFIVISYLLSVFLYVRYIGFKKNFNIFVLKVGRTLVFSLMTLSTMLSLIATQMIGSNKSAVLVLMTYFILITGRALLSKKNIRTYISNKYRSLFKLIFFRYFLYIIIFSIVGVLISVTVLLAFSYYFNIELSTTRLGGYGEGFYNPLATRIDLFTLFLPHMSYSGLLGNMNVDCMTTGCGTFIHSSLLMLLTHTGIVGLLLFCTYLLFALKESNKLRGYYNESSVFIENINQLYLKVILAVVFMMSLIGTAISWSVLWFLFGMVFPFVVITSKSGKESSAS